MLSQNKHFLVKITKYSNWANNRIRSVLQEIDDQKFCHNLGKIFVNDTNCTNPSIRSIIEHCMMGFYFCIQIMREIPFKPQEIILKLRQTSKNQLIEEWARIDVEYAQLIDKNWGKPVQFNKQDFILNEDFFFAFSNHMIYHRGQIMTAMKLIGAQGIDTDYMTFLNEMTK